jgi:hypothetical protein
LQKMHEEQFMKQAELGLEGKQHLKKVLRWRMNARKKRCSSFGGKVGLLRCSYIAYQASGRVAADGCCLENKSSRQR